MIAVRAENESACPDVIVLLFLFAINDNRPFIASFCPVSHMIAVRAENGSAY
jgi:hypothetical protein